MLRPVRSVAVVFLLLWSSPGFAQQPAYGLVTHDMDDRRAGKMKDLGAGYARISFRWWQIEATKGAFNWTTIDDYVWNQAAPRGIRLFVSLGEPPDWAAVGGKPNGTPKSMDEWYGFVFRAVSRYKAYVRHWGIWNEPNLTQFLDDRANYQQIAFWARKAIKDADPTALVLGPEVSEQALDSGWFASVMSTYGVEYFDIVTVHVYTGSLTARMDSQVYPWRFGKEVWLTEIGKQTYSGITAFEVIQRDFYGDTLDAFESRRWWWTKIFFYDVWAWDYGYRFGICSPTWTNHLAFDFYRDWIKARPQTSAALDFDRDGLPDEWEGMFGLSTRSGTGNDGPDGDPDGDGLTNLQEYLAGSHPRGFFKRYLAEGASSDFFETVLAIVNVNPTTAANVLVRFFKADGSIVSLPVTIAKMTRRTINATDVPGLSPGDFSTLVESDVQVIVDRTMKWDRSHYGSHAETAVDAPATTWFLAEGATHSGFNAFYLLQNPNAVPATAQVTYLLPAPAAPIVKSYAVAPRSRFTIWVNREDPRLAATDVSASINADQPIVVERSMYLDAGGRKFGAGHNSMGVTSPALNWFLAEGATGSFFDLFILLANPNDTEARVRAQYLLPSGGAVVRDYVVPARSRFTIWVDNEDPRLADTAVSTALSSTNAVPIVVERAMWWPGPTATSWYEAHDSAGATTTSTRWGLADGELGGLDRTETYILVANTSTLAGAVKVSLLFEDGSSVAKTVAVPAASRLNIVVAAMFPTAANRRFGAIVESLGTNPAQIVVERAMYSSSGDVIWAAGTNALGTRLQ